MHTAICAFQDRARAEEALAALARAGFARDDLHMEFQSASPERKSAPAAAAGDPDTADRGVLSSFGHFFASLLGRDNPSGQVDTYAQHLRRGAYVVMVDADTADEAQRARMLLQEMQGGDLDVLPRPGQRRLREIVAGRGGEPAGMVALSSAGRERWSPGEEMARERAMAAGRLDAIRDPKSRDPDASRPPGLRYADQDKPR